MDISLQHTVQSVKRSREDSSDPDVISQTPKRPRTSVTVAGRRHVKYQRYSKPPYTYLGMMVLAIQSSPDKRLSLAEIQETLAEMFPFFRGEYRGWRDSVRHNLSHNACFVKTSRKQTKKGASGCLWEVDLTLVPADAFKRGRVHEDLETKWAPTLTQQLRVSDIHLPAPRTPPKKIWPAAKKQQTTATTPSQDDAAQFLTPSPSLSYTEAQYTRYLREQTADSTVPLSQYPAFATLLYDNVTSDFTSAADNLHRLCPAAQYGNLCQSGGTNTHEPRTPHLRYPSLAPDTPQDVTPSAPIQFRIKVEDTPSPCIAPTNEDPFRRYFSDFSSVVPDSLIHLSEAAEQTTSVRQPTSPGLHTTTPLTHSKYEPISPTSKTSESLQFCPEASLPDSAIFVQPAAPSECSTISYISESSVMSSTSTVSTLSRDTTLPLTDFSTVSFQDLHNDTSLSDIFA